jgi:alkylation response protein AidB-like acyl-CoA dehydrogenase
MTGQNEFCGGRFLLADATSQQIFTPEDFSPEQRQIVEMTRKFAAQCVAPVIDRIEQKDFALMRQLMLQAGDLGLFAVDVPEQYGGLQMNKTTSALIAEWISVCASLSVTFISHSGIGLLPLLWYGTLEQKKRYLPGLISGETIAAYALSEGSSGSDALNIRATAVRSEDGSKFILNGEKMWISNAGFAGLFTIFAKIDGKHFSAFLVEAGTPGLSIGKEESKMGIRGSSTCPVVLRDCVVPASSLLGVAGKGHYIAFNVLNVGRYKLGAMVLGGARYALLEAIDYGKQRAAFGKSIVEFGLIQEKIAESAAMIYVAEALVYRTAGSIDESLKDVDPGCARYAEDVQSRITRYAVECSIAKVWCSEMQSVVVDHVMQIHGGYGFTEDYPAARYYRDARINRIFEGTNEINRLIIISWTEKDIRSALSAIEHGATIELSNGAD